MFYTNDYMVSSQGSRYCHSSFLTKFQIHRRSGYVSTLKMYSNRTKNTECLNSQNVRTFNRPLRRWLTSTEGFRLPPLGRNLIHVPHWRRVRGHCRVLGLESHPRHHHRLWRNDPELQSYRGYWHSGFRWRCIGR